jgi:hypothetical protein
MIKLWYIMNKFLHYNFLNKNVKCGENVIYLYINFFYHKCNIYKLVNYMNKNNQIYNFRKLVNILILNYYYWKWD